MGLELDSFSGDFVNVVLTQVFAPTVEPHTDIHTKGEFFCIFTTCCCIHLTSQFLGYPLYISYNIPVKATAFSTLT